MTHATDDSAALNTPPSSPAWTPRGGPLEACVPLALLEAVRSLDLPSDDLDTELVHELRNKRLGLSDTVYMQIQRYAEAARRQQRVPFDEVLALARLVGRRPDADILYREAGRRVARTAVQTVGAGTRRATRALPAAAARPLALRQLRTLSQRFLAGTLQRQGDTLLLQISEPVTVDMATGSTGCGFFEAALRELLLQFTGADAAVVQVACRSRGDASCQFRTDWRR